VNRTKTVAEVVTLGAELLDKSEPSWYSHVDVDELNMAGMNHDVLAMVFGTHQAGIVHLLGAKAEQQTIDDFRRAHGLDVDRERDWENIMDEDYNDAKALDDAWTEEVLYRLDNQSA